MTGANDQSVSEFLNHDLDAFLDAFLDSGWMLALDGEKILVGWGEWTEAADAPGSCALFAPDFYLGDPHPWKWTQHWKLLQRDQFATLVLSADKDKVNSDAAVGHGFASGEIGGGKTDPIQWFEPSPAEFKKSWQAIQDGFNVRGLLKAVPIVFATSHFSFGRRRRLAALRRLVAQPKILFPYGLWNGTAGLMGASPEILFSQLRSPRGQNQSVEAGLETVALAGTRVKGSTVSLLDDPKERFEHQLVVDDLAARLKTLGDVQVGATAELELPSLYHLQTRLRVRPRRAFSFADGVRLLHPTPALGVAPRSAGFAEMRLWDEPSARFRFGAPFGVRAPGIDHCLVAIRNVQWQQDEVRLGSGCGVVGASVFDREWNELRAKRDSVKRMLDL